VVCSLNILSHNLASFLFAQYVIDLSLKHDTYLSYRRMWVICMEQGGNENEELYESEI